MTSMNLILLAQQQNPAPAGGGVNVIGFWIPMILVFVMLHFLLIRPQKKRQQELQKQIDSLQIGDTIVTTGGIHGIVANKADHTLTVKVADNVKIKLEKAAVARVLSKERLPAQGAGPETETKPS